MNKLFNIVIFSVSLLVVCVATVFPEESKSLDVQISEFIYSDEFKAAEIARLDSLPVGAVSVLSKMLDEKQIGDPRERRIYQCLAIKLAQYEQQLSAADKSQAIASLLRKVQGTSQSDRVFRLNLLRPIKASQISNVVNGE